MENSNSILFENNGYVHRAHVNVPATHRMFRISWTISAVILDPLDPSLSPARDPISTFGSSIVTGDEFRFDHNGKLVSGLLHSPEDDEDWANWAPSLMCLPVRGLGDLVMEDHSHFNVYETTLRLFDPKGSMLAGLFEGVTPDQLDGRFLVAEDFELLTAKGRYCGWILHSPLAHTGEGGEKVVYTSEDVALLTEFFQLVNDNTIDQIYSHDPVLKLQFEDLLRRIQVEETVFRSPRKALAKQLNKLLKRWFYQ